MLFSTDELSLLIPAIEEYVDSDYPTVLPGKKSHAAVIYDSCIKKLEHLSALTYFSKPEYRAMLMAFELIIDDFIEASSPIPPEFSALRTKLSVLAKDPSLDQ